MFRTSSTEEHRSRAISHEVDSLTHSFLFQFCPNYGSTHSLTHSLIHSLTSHFHAQSGAHIRSLTHPDSFISKSHRVECKRTHSVASHSHKQIRGHTHEPPILTNRGMEGTLTHSLTDLPLEGVGGQIGDHTHSNSLSHTDSKARSLSHSLTHSLTLTL